MPFIPLYDVYSSPYLVTFFIFALIETLLCSGITYGWASIVVVFKEERFYMELCRSFFRNQNKTNEKIATNFNLQHGRIVRSAVGYVDDGTLPGCPIQDARLNLIFTVSLFFLCGIKFPAGIFIDKCGPKIARSVGGAMYIIACIGLGFVTIGYENLLFPIFAFICMGGSLLVVAVYQVANIVYRKSRSRIICILHGAFDSSAVVMLIFKLMYESGLSLQQIMIGYSALCLALILLGTVFLIPPLQILLHWTEEEAEINQNFNRRFSILAGPDFAVSSSQSYHDYLNINITNNGYGAHENGICIDEVKKLTNPNTTNEKYDTKEDADTEITKNFQEDDEEPLVTSFLKTSRFRRGSILHSVFSLLYLFELIFLLTFQLKLWYFVGSLTDFLERLSLNDKKTVSEYINLFGYIQFGGLLITPVIGFVFDKSRLTPAKEAVLTKAERRLQRLRECIAPFLLTNVLCLLFCVLSMIEDIRFQVPSFILYTAVRGFLYADHGAFMGAAFPASQFGTLYGLGIFIGGTFGVLQYALFKLTSGPLKGNPFWTNIILLILVSLGNLHPLYLWWYVRSETKRIQSKRSITSRTGR